MNIKELFCPKCKSNMIEGILLLEISRGTANIPKWISGKPEGSF